ncbi:MAG: cytochrome c [Planctomycetes bacterium]|nr:cytochrome c [Planctomycetota bacterium]
MLRTGVASLVLFAVVVGALVGCEGCGKTGTGPGTGGGNGTGGGQVGAAAAVAAVRLAPRSPLTQDNSVIDAGNGAALFRPNCASCHGYAGDGQGPAASYFERRPRDLTDANYLNTRTDEQLLEILASGGSHMKRSGIMPAWGTFFTVYERKDLVAYVRTHHPRVGPQVPGAVEGRLRWATLSAEKAAGLGVALADDERRLAWWRLYSEVAAGKPPDDAKLVGFAVFARARLGGDGTAATVQLGFSKDLKLASAGVHPKVVLVRGEQADENAVDAWLSQFAGKTPAELKELTAPPSPIADFADGCKALFETVRRLALQLGPALEQDKADYAALAAYADPKNLPATKSDGERVFREKKCWECHGHLGNAKSLGVLTTDPDPRDLTDRAVMSKLSDDFLRDLIKKGGRYVNASATMPAYGSNVTDAEVDALIAYLRSLSGPAGK